MTRDPIRLALVVAFAALVGTGTLRADDKKAVKELQRVLEEADRKAKLLEKRLAEAAKVEEAIRQRNAELKGQTPKKALPQAPAPRPFTGREMAYREAKVMQEYTATVAQMRAAIRDFKEQTEKFKVQNEKALQTFEERLRREIEQYEKRRKEFEKNEERTPRKVLPQAPAPRPARQN